MHKLWISLILSVLSLSLMPMSKAEVRLLAPASMGTIAKSLEDHWHGDEPLKVLIGPTSQLVRQALQGLDAHILITANSDWMEEAIKGGLVKEDSNRPYISNS